MSLLEINNSSVKDMLKKMLFAIVFFLSSAINSFGSSKDDVLLVVHEREITRYEFLYHFRKNYQDVNQRNFDEFLGEFIILQLKLVQAREEGINHNIGFINELAEYRLILSAPYLTDNEKQQEFVHEALGRLKYEIKIDQILVKYEVDYNNDSLNTCRKAGEIRNRLLNGESFEKVAKLYSGDRFIIYKPNIDVFISAFETEYHIESVAFKLKKGEISMPVKSTNGYSIIQLSDKRESQKIQKTEQEILNRIKDANDERMQLIEDAFVTKLKKEWNLKEYQEALNKICLSADERIYKGNWTPDSKTDFEEVLLTIDDKGILQNNFIDYMQNVETTDRSLTIKEYIHSLYTKFVVERLIQYENLKLPEKYPEFRFQYEEYRDAMLLLQITKQKVWVKAENNNPDEFENFVQADYQNFIMKEWIEELRAKYKVQINKEVLMSIKQQL